jgi:hypothetical protein
MSYCNQYIVVDRRYEQVSEMFGEAYNPDRRTNESFFLEINISSA